jgi:hypothetical protein
VVTVNSGGGAPGRHHGADSLDAVFAAPAAGWERPGPWDSGRFWLDALNAE